MKETLREKVAEGNGICKIGRRKYQETTKVKANDSSRLWIKLGGSLELSDMLIKGKEYVGARKQSRPLLLRRR